MCSNFRCDRVFITNARLDEIASTSRSSSRFRLNMAHIRQSRPDSGLSLRVKALKFEVDPSDENLRVLNFRTTALQKCAAVPRRARI